MISVIMGVHKIDGFIDEAIRSILNQSYQNFEFIIVANGESSNEIYDWIMATYASEDRIVCLRSEIAQLAHALNVAIDTAKYDFIARMDADDVAHPHRLEKQITYLKSNSLDMVGCDLQLIDEENKVLGV